MIRSSFILVLCFIAGKCFTQGFKNLEQDKDSIFGVIILSCETKYGKGRVDYDKMDRWDSLVCHKTSHYPLENSNKVLCVVRNYFGDTLAIGLKEEKSSKEKWSFFKRPFFRVTRSIFGDKIGDWYYYDPEGELKEVVNYDPHQTN